MSITKHDVARMRNALALALRGPIADPNPRVGCVITARDAVTASDGATQGDVVTPRDSDEDAIVGRGWHEGAGTPHAEVMALQAAGARARGGAAYVTLEPCTHTGRTGPCADALLAAGVSRVVIAASDPSALAGGGAQQLRRAGVVVETGVLAGEAEALNLPWSHSVTVGRPFVTWKLASTLDGRIAADDGTSRWITGETARAQVHQLRAEVGAIMVGTGTVLADDPALTVRGVATDGGRQPLRVVVGDREPPSGAKIFDKAAETLVCRTHDLANALATLQEREIRHVLLEGGPTLAAAFLRAGLIDRIVAYVAPALLGSGRAAVGDLGIHTINGAQRWRLTSVTQVGDDARLDLVPEGRQ